MDGCIFFTGGRCPRQRENKMNVLRILLLTVVLGVAMGRPDCCGPYPRPRICKRLRANCPQQPSVHVCCRSDIPRPKMCSYVRVPCPPVIESLPPPDPTPIHDCCRTDIPLPPICIKAREICPRSPTVSIPKPDPISEFCAKAFVNCSSKTYRPSRRDKRQTSIGGYVGNGGRSGSINISHQSRKWGSFGANGNFAKGSKPSWGISWSKKFRK